MLCLALTIAQSALDNAISAVEVDFLVDTIAARHKRRGASFPSELKLYLKGKGVVRSIVDKFK
jgi:hypothetical protein